MVKEKINVAELLRNCPKGMELDCTMFDDVKFSHIQNDEAYPIVVTILDTDKEVLTAYGTWNDKPNAKCLIFPKGKTTWDGFHRPFKDGDIVTCKDRGSLIAFIYKERKNVEVVKYHFALYIGGVGTFTDGEICLAESEIVFATEEEKAELFNAIKANGYKWNEEAKTLEKLVEPKFKDGDIVSTRNGMWIGIVKKPVNRAYETYITINGESLMYDNPIFCFERFATDKEKAKLLKAIKDNGYKWNEETKTLEKLIDPKFKIEKGKWYVCIKDLLDNYANKAFRKGDTYLSTQDGSLIPSNSNVPFEVVYPGTYFRDWTIQDAKEGDVLAFNDEIIVIFKDLYNKTSFHSYCHIEDGIFTISKEDMPDWWGGRGFYPATKEQCNLLFQKIKAEGYEWTTETKTFGKLIEPKFKVWDKVKHKDDKTVITITGIKDNYYLIQFYNSNRNDYQNEKVSFKDQDKYELVPNKFDTNTLEKLISPKFKVGDRIKHKTHISQGDVITEIKDTHFILNDELELPFIFQDEYVLIQNKFNINTLKPFESKVLVRGSDPLSEWKPAIFGIYREDKHYSFYVVGGNCWKQCIPYEGNEHLLGTTNDCDEYFKSWES